MTRLSFLRGIPIAVTAIGICIHVLGVAGLFVQTSFIHDLIMLGIDCFVLTGLLRRTAWGYYLAVGLYIQQSVMQPYWAYKSYLAEYFFIHPMVLFLAPIVVMTSLIILLTNKVAFIRHQ